MSDSLTKDELLVAIYGTWHIWKERCRRVFQQGILSEVQIVELLIKDDLLLLRTHLLKITQEEVEIETGPLLLLGTHLLNRPGAWQLGVICLV